MNTSPGPAAIALAIASTLAACASGPPDPVIGRALGDIRSGRLDLVVEASTQRGPVGFRLDGPFELAEEGELPLADLRYERMLGDRVETLRLVSDGTTAALRAGEDDVPLSPAAQSSLRAIGPGGLNIDLGPWLLDHRSEAGPEVDGVPTRVVHARLDPVAVIADLAAMLGLGSASSIDDVQAQAIRRAASAATLDATIGDDGLLRAAELRLAFEVPDDGIRTALGEFGELELRMTVRVESPNEPAFAS